MNDKRCTFEHFLNFYWHLSIGCGGIVTELKVSRHSVFSKHNVVQGCVCRILRHQPNPMKGKRSHRGGKGGRAAGAEYVKHQLGKGNCVSCKPRLLKCCTYMSIRLLIMPRNVRTMSGQGIRFMTTEVPLSRSADRSGRCINPIELARRKPCRR